MSDIELHYSPEQAAIRGVFFSMADDGKTIYLFIQPQDNSPMIGVTIRKGKIFGIPDGKTIRGDQQAELPHNILMGLFPHLKGAFKKINAKGKTQKLLLAAMQILADSLRKYNDEASTSRADQIEAWIKTVSK